MKSQIISSMTSFVLGTGATLVALSTWLGTTDLQTIRTSVQNYMTEVEGHSSALAQDYQVTVNSANKEIGEYQKALEQANSNIDKLVTAYNNAETKHQEDLADMDEFYQLELADLQAELERMETRLDSQYETDMNKVIEQANAQINKANEEVGQTKENVLNDLKTSQVDEIVANAKQLKDQLNTGNDKSVKDISSIVPSEQPQE